MAPDDDIILRRTNYFQHEHLIYLHLNDYVGYHNGFQYDNCRHNDLIFNAIQHDYGTQPPSFSLSGPPRTSLTIL
ncbi:hypothetical protein LTR53_008261 [Teratosphaeriaceae sp. CCFEE 6253]|nr:hypothetical protein LTR53_008261 [Teratosphaeriaceae sp. CCFEE 6253]